MFRIKICGITRGEDAAIAVSSGADAVGLNFYPLSRRFVQVEDAQHVLAMIPVPVRKVGVFVNASLSDLLNTARRLGLDAVQLHGDEPPEIFSQIPSSLAIIRAYRCDSRGLFPLADYVGACRKCGRVPDAVLIDAQVDAANEYGGTGRVADWERIARDREMVDDVPLILAGGLTPANVAEAIVAVRPHGVDVATGVEAQPGRKDTTLVQEFVSAARGAFARL